MFVGLPPGCREERTQRFLCWGPFFLGAAVIRTLELFGQPRQIKTNIDNNRQKKAPKEELVRGGPFLGVGRLVSLGLKLGSWLRAWSLGFRAWGFRVSGFRCLVLEGLGFRVSAFRGLGFWVLRA